MTLPNWKALRRLTLAALLPIFLSACAADRDIRAAARQQADASQVGAALAAASVIPDLPADCRAIERSGVNAGDRLDTAVLKADAAAARANARVERCAAWHDQIRQRESGR